MATAHLLHGFIGVGKTTFARELEQSSSAIRFSIDEWITQLYGRDPAVEKFDDAHDRATELIWTVAARALTLGQDVILDFGFWSRASRDDARERVRNTGAMVCFYAIVCDDSVACSRTLERTEQKEQGVLHIDAEARTSLRSRFEPIGLDEPHIVVHTDKETTVNTAVSQPSDVVIEPATTGQSAQCEPILRSLPEWFGIESALRHYMQEIDRLPTLIARQKTRAIGFLSIKEHSPFSAEIYVMGVYRQNHRQGIGRLLVRTAEARLRSRNTEYFQVKTLAESHDDLNYAKTRAFYQSVGFRAIEEFPDLWPSHSCLQMVKHL